MTDQLFVYGIAALMIGLFVGQVVSRRFDPFAPVWLFLVGYAQVYIVQPISYRDWALRVRGIDLVTAANGRALWALVVFLLVYHLGIARFLARLLPKPPESWSPGLAAMVSPPLILWGMICGGLLLRGGALSGDDTGAQLSDAEALFRSFPAVMLAGAVFLLVTGRQPDKPRPGFLVAGLASCVMYSLLWMFNGRRSHSLLGVLATLCAFYVARQKRPSWPVLAAAACAGALVVGLAIGWRGNMRYERTVGGFLEFAADFRPESILESLNIKEREEAKSKSISYETEEYGGFLLMMDTVPDKADYDYGAPYVRIVTTFIPRMVWPTKPLPGREKWVNAWIAGSELPRDSSFTGPAIGVLGAAQLNGGAWGTLIVMTFLGLLLRTSYEYFRLHGSNPWIQAWWALTYYNAWFMTVADDPLNWFYYNWGFTTFPPLAVLWIMNKLTAAPAPAVVPQFV
jgi:hypothetical protein